VSEAIAAGSVATGAAGSIGRAARVALKIDVDTFRGTRDGVPALLEDLAAAGVRASFFFTLGPDNSGRAVLRVFRKRGFLAKMLRTNAARMYGWRTALYGTLLPAPEIGRRCRATLEAVQAAGHEVGLHAWDHVTWQDRLDRMPRAAVEAHLDRGIAAFEAIFGARPRSFAAPAWFCTDQAFAALDARGFGYLSVSRGAAAPFYPRVAGRTLATLEVPTTLPTLDEELGRDGIGPDNYVTRLVARYRPGQHEVLTVHAETEGLAYRNLFQDLLRRHREIGVATGTVEELAAEARPGAREAEIGYGEVAGRAGRVVLAGLR
jgi:undecaprenyl phosphate-alpha-L-ara4FN deformylase